MRNPYDLSISGLRIAPTALANFITDDCCSSYPNCGEGACACSRNQSSLHCGHFRGADNPASGDMLIFAPHPVHSYEIYLMSPSDTMILRSDVMRLTAPSRLLTL